MKTNIRRVSNDKRTTIVSLNDWHVPYEDEKAIAVAFSFCKRIQPDIIVVHEAHDFYSLSSFDKDPKRVESLQYEIDTVAKYLKQLRSLCPKSRIIFLDSNHLDRLRKYLWKQAPALSSLRSLKIEVLLDLKSQNIEFKEVFCYKDFLFKHGDIVRRFSGYTAKGELEKEGMSGATGHTHRVGEHYSTKRGGTYKWIECGCLCDLHPEYINGTPDWQHGIGLISFKNRSKRFYAQAIPIIDYKILFGDMEISVR